ncbi:MAG: AAA domain-containing protein, partial [Saprospiraceae bacterium]|nr:AAA domain-containing protein [Saprospiraceae bacterium]
MPEELYDAAPFNETEGANTEKTRTRLNLTKVQETVSNIKQELHKIIVGQEQLMDLLLIAIFSNGHVLLEGMPGIAKTLTARMIAQALEMPFSRIQFTPDLMPSDVVGTTVFNMQTSQFTFNAG